jgi:hypothetical protein
MAKVKIFLLIFITVLLTYFIIENSVLAPPIKFLGQQLFQVHTSIIIITSFFLGLIFGCLGHVSWSRNRQKIAELSLRDQQVPEPQDHNQQEEDKK